MSEFVFRETHLSGAYLIDNFSSSDNRGGFVKCFEKNIYAKAGIEFVVNEVFFSVSAENVIRGLHFQKHNPQAKLVTVIDGAVWDVIVDLRPFSKTYQMWNAFELNEKNCKGLYIPEGFAHGFLSLRDDTKMLYMCSGTYDALSDSGIVYNDCDIGIKWPIDSGKAILSKRDMELETFQEYELSPIVFEGR